MKNKIKIFFGITFGFFALFGGLLALFTAFNKGNLSFKYMFLYGSNGGASLTPVMFGVFSLAAIWALKSNE